MSNEVIAVRKSGSADLWSALEQAAPELGVAIRNAEPTPTWRYNDRPGFREWLIAQWAMNNPAAVVADQLKAIIEDQEASGIIATWPPMGKRQLETSRRDLAPEWQPLREVLQSQIAQVGIARKQARLLAYQSLVETLGERMWDERNSKTGQLYLQKPYMDALRAVAEEMGDLGTPADGQMEGLIDIARELVSIIKVQGAGLQENEATGIEEFDYQEGVFTEVETDESTPVSGEGSDLQEDELPSEPGAHQGS